MLKRYNVFIVTTDPTRGTAMLDVFLTNNTTRVSEKGVINPQLSDHASCYVTQDCKLEKAPKNLSTCVNTTK